MEKLLADDGQFYPNTNIFRDNAPSYWALGLPVIPLKARTKEASLLKRWQEFSSRMPTEQERQLWLNDWSDCNLGLPLGPQSGCVAIDIDTTDPKLISIIQQVCGTSPWERIGSKGKVLMYRYSGEQGFKIKEASGKMICECLSIGNQVVLPPSIHPDTQRPYTCNIPLTQAKMMLQPLPINFEDTLREALKEAGVVLSHSGWTRTTDYVSRGSRDIKMTAMAGFFANGVERGEWTLNEAIERLKVWKATCVENIAGDDIDIEKGIQNICKFLVSDVLGPKKKMLPQGWDEGLTPEEKKKLGLDFSADMTEWGLSQILDYLDVSVDKLDSPIKKTQAFEYVIQKIAHSPHLTTTERDVALGRMFDLGDGILTKTSMKERLRELTQVEMEGKDHTELAESVIADFEKIGKIKFYHDSFWQWRGSNWEKMEDVEILRHIAKEYGHYPAAKKASDHKGIRDVMKAMVRGELATVSEKGINFANGFLNQDGILLEHKPEYGCTYTLPYRYMPEMKDMHPKFDQFLTRVWGHCPDFEERKRALQEAMCATYFGLGPSFARAILLRGIASSGKSQLIDIVRYLIPQEVVTYVSPYCFQKDFLVAELSRSLLNVCGELDAKKFIPDAEFKSIVDGSSLQASYKYGQYFSFSPQCTHWFASNPLPKSRDTSEGFFRRWLILTFDKQIKSDEKVRGIGELIAAEEREGIMAWVVDCIVRLCKKGDYTLPKSHFEVMDMMIGENDSVFFYIKSKEGPKRKTDAKCSLNTIYEKYSTFCYATSKCKPIGLRSFLSRLTELAMLMGFEVNGLEIRGLELD